MNANPMPPKPPSKHAHQPLTHKTHIHKPHINKYVRHAVFPVAGRGSRLSPVTRSVNKALIPVLNRPLLHWAMIEAKASGIEHFIVIIDPHQGKSVEGYFQPPFGPDNDPQACTELAWIAERTVFIQQKQARGLGHAVACAQQELNHVPFAVILADDVLFADTPFLGQMIQAHASIAHPAAIVACEEVPENEVSRYGILDWKKNEDPCANNALRPVRDLIEKPPVDKAPSRMAIIGRYILPPQIFDALAQTQPGSGGEIQLTDALRALQPAIPIYACPSPLRRHDCGSINGLVTAHLEAALRQTKGEEKEEIHRRILDILS